MLTVDIDANACIQGLIDIDVEIERCEKKKKVSQIALDKIKKNEAHPNYDQTVDDETRAANEEKVRSIGIPLHYILIEIAETATRG